MQAAIGRARLYGYIPASAEDAVPILRFMNKNVYDLYITIRLKKRDAALGIAADTPHPPKAWEEYERKARP